MIEDLNTVEPPDGQPVASLSATHPEKSQVHEQGKELNIETRDMSRDMSR